MEIFLTTSSRPSQKHHFVPQAQLRHFAADVEQSFLFVFAKQSDRSFQSSILNAGSENDFNTVEFGDSKWNFEYLFREVDTCSAHLVAKIISRRSVAWLTRDDRIALVDLFTTQLLRTHFSRTTPKIMVEQLREIVRQVGYDPDQDPSMATPSDAALRLGAVKLFLNRDDHAAALFRLAPALYTSCCEQRFIISDHPVAISNAFPYGDLGLTSHGIIVCLPISPDLTIALHCPTIVKRYELAERADIEFEQKSQALSYRDHLRSGEPIKIDADMVFALNWHQVTQSRSYLYSNTDSFEFAREILREHPELRMVETHVGVGKMGGGLPSRRSMPTGRCLVIRGPFDHCMLAIEEIDETGEGLTACTLQVDLLAQIAADPGMLQTELCIDGHVTLAIGEAMIECFGEPSNGWFRVVHRDPSLRELNAKFDTK